MLESPIPALGDLRRQVQEAISSRDTRQRERKLLQTWCHDYEEQPDSLRQSNNPEVARGAQAGTPLNGIVYGGSCEELRATLHDQAVALTRLKPGKHTCEELLLASRQLGSLQAQLGNAAEELASAQEAVTATLEATRQEAATSTRSMVSVEELASASKERTKAQEELHQAKVEMAEAMRLLDSGEDSNMLARLQMAKQELREQERCSELELEAERERHELEVLKLEQRVSAEEYPREKKRDALTEEVTFLRGRLRHLTLKADTRLRETRFSQVEVPDTERDIKTSKVHVQPDKLEPVAQQLRELTTEFEAMRAAASRFANEQVKDLVLQLRAQAEEFQTAEAELQPV